MSMFRKRAGIYFKHLHECGGILMSTYGSRDKNLFPVPKEYEINGVKTQSNIGDKRYYLLVDSSTGE
jgi:hypothetical protein